MKSIGNVLENKLKLKINEKKSAVCRPWKKKFLGFIVSVRKEVKLKVAPESIAIFKKRVREITRRTRGVSLKQVIHDVGIYLKGWINYYRLSQIKVQFRDLDCWIRRRLRSVLWKQWGRRGYKELRRRGIDNNLAWNTAKSVHGPWRLSHSPALEIALSVTYFTDLGLPQLNNFT